MNRMVQLGASLLLVASVTACVTINIYFPAAAAEKAADKIIDNIWQMDAAAKVGKSTAPDKEATPPKNDDKNDDNKGTEKP